MADVATWISSKLQGQVQEPQGDVASWISQKLSGGALDRLRKPQAPQEVRPSILVDGQEEPAPDFSRGLDPFGSAVDPQRRALAASEAIAANEAERARALEHSMRIPKAALGAVAAPIGAAEAFGLPTGLQPKVEKLQSRMAPPATDLLGQTLEAFGQTLPIMAAAPISMPLAGAMGVSQQVLGAYQNTLQATGDEKQARRAGLLNAPVGLLDLALPSLSKLPVGRGALAKLLPFLARLDERSGGRLSGAVLGAGTEMTTEALQTVLENGIANLATEEDRPYLQGVKEILAPTGLVGAIFQGITGRPFDTSGLDVEAKPAVKPNLEAQLERSRQIGEAKVPPPGFPVREGQALPGASPSPTGPVTPGQHSMAQEEVATQQPQAIPGVGTERRVGQRRQTELERAADYREAVEERRIGAALGRRIEEVLPGPEQLAQEEQLKARTEAFAQDALAPGPSGALGEAERAPARGAEERISEEEMRDVREFVEGEQAAKGRAQALQKKADEQLEQQFQSFEAASKGSGPNLEQAPAQGRKAEQAPTSPPGITQVGPQEAAQEVQAEPEQQAVLSFPGGLIKAPGVKQAAAFAKRELTSQGDLPDVAFRQKQAREGGIGAEIQKADFAARDLRKAIKRFAKFEHFVKQETASGSIEVGVGKKPLGQRKLSAEQTELLNEALKGNKEAKAALPSGIAEAVGKMRLHLDALSRRMVQEGVVQGDLAAKIDSNLGVYLNRSYQVFDDPKWADKVPPDVFNRAVNLIRTEAQLARLSGDPKKVAKAQVDPEAYIRSLLDEASKSDGFIGMLKEGKLGSKDLSILTKRKEIAPEIRELFGEYKDPVVNYMRSVQKMAGLIESHNFLSTVKNEGLGKFLFQKAQGPHIRKIAADASDVMYPLNGLYTTPEIERAFSEQFGAKNEAAWLRLWMKANGITKYGKTVLNPMTHARNTLGNSGFAIANGHWRLGAWKKALSGIHAKLRGSDPEARAYVEKAVRLGVLDEGTHAGEIRDVLKDAMKGDPEDFAATGPKRVLTRMNRAVATAYQLEDGVWKLYAWENEMARYKGLGLPEAELEQMAAKIVRDTYPTYSLVPKGIQKLRRFPITGTFVSFPAEVFRVAKNTIKLAASDLKSSNTVRRRAGAERLAGIVAASSMTGIAAMVSRMVNGLDSEDDENARVFMPPWSKDSDILWLGNNERGNRLWVDLSYTDPWSYLKQPVMALMRGESPDESITNGLKRALEPFSGEEIFTQALIDVARNKKQSGGDVYNEAASTQDQAKDIALHLLEPVTPGVAAQMQRIYRGFTGYVSPYGKSYDPGLEALSMLSGVRVNELDPQQGLGFIGGDMEKKYQGASSLLTGVAARRGTVSDDELLGAYGKMERIRRASFKDLHKAFKAAIALGVSVEDAKRGLSGRIAAKYIQDLEHGRYVPYVPSGSFLDSYLKSSSPEERGEYQRRKRLLEQHARSLGAIPIEDL